MKKRSPQQLILLAAFSVLAGYAITAKEQLWFFSGAQKMGFVEKMLQMFRVMLPDSTIVIILTIGFIFFAMNQTLFLPQNKFSKQAFIVSGLFAFFRLLGISFAIDNSLNFIVDGGFQFLHAMLVFAGYWFLFYGLVKALFRKIDTMHIERQPAKNKVLCIADRHMFLFALLSILVCWSLFWMFFFPGSLPHDGQSQLEIYFGARNPSQDHPYFVTLFMGFIVDIGKAILSYKLGIFMYVLLQSTACASIYAACCSYIHKKGAPYAVTLISVTFFCFVPLFASYAQAVIKDTLYIGLFVLFVLECTKLYLGDSGKWGIFRLIGAGIICCLFRNEALYTFSIALLIFLITYKDKRKVLVVALAIIVAVHTATGYIFTNVLNIRKGSTKEIFSIPLQQTARYVIKHQDEITQEERAVISEIIDYDQIPSKYTPEKADNIKNSWRSAKTQQGVPTSEEISAYFSIWFNMFLKDPVVYAEATINHFYGYFDPLCTSNNAAQHQTYNKGPISSARQPITFNEYLATDTMRNIGNTYLEVWNKIPVLSMFCYCGVYSWLMILQLANLIRKHKTKDIVILALPLLTLGICCMSPVNCYTRYMLPIIACTPLLCWFALRDNFKEN